MQESETPSPAPRRRACKIISQVTSKIVPPLAPTHVALYVRFGSLADIAADRRHVPFTPVTDDRQPTRRQQSRQCVTTIKSSGLRNSAVTPVSLTEFLEIKAIWGSLGLERVTHRNAVRSIAAMQVYRASRLCSGGRVGPCSMHATGADAGARIQWRYSA